MPHFSSRSNAILSTCHPELQILFKEVIKEYDCSVICGFRCKGDQDKAFDDGKSKAQFPWSKHNKLPSIAVDVGPYDPVIKNIPWFNGIKEEMSFKEIMAEVERLKVWYFFGAHVQGVAKRLGLKVRWGGDWDGDFNFKDQNFHDLPHFELEEI